MRINNHEHTDLQEYLGSYVTDANGGVCHIVHVLEPTAQSLGPRV